jgi:hypothetical protein
MMRLTWRDGLATMLVAAAALLFVLWETGAALVGTSTRAIGVMVCWALRPARLRSAVERGSGARPGIRTQVRGLRLAPRVANA